MNGKFSVRTFMKVCKKNVFSDIFLEALYKLLVTFKYYLPCLTLCLVSLNHSVDFNFHCTIICSDGFLFLFFGVEGSRWQCESRCGNWDVFIMEFF